MDGRNSRTLELREIGRFSALCSSRPKGVHAAIFRHLPLRERGQLPPARVAEKRDHGDHR